jgi:type II secretory ATPase GspE/PulE/Tfp pilus assembly ATPase PilB-like protein
MGLPEFLVAATVKAVLAQRLSRRLCSECKKARAPNAEEIAVFKKHEVPMPADAKVFDPVGCDKCKNSGFKGRMGLHELLVMTDEMRAYCVQGLTADALRVAAVKQGMILISQDGLYKVLLGETTVREVLGGTD